MPVKISATTIHKDHRNIAGTMHLFNMLFFDKQSPPRQTFGILTSIDNSFISYKGMTPIKKAVVLEEEKIMPPKKCAYLLENIHLRILFLLKHGDFLQWMK